MRYISIILFYCSIIIFPIEDFLPNDQEWVHLSTLWDATGFIGDISPSGEYVIIENGQVKKLVHILTGGVIRKIENGLIYFDSTGQFARTIQFASETDTVPNPTITNLQTFENYTVENIYNHIWMYDPYLVTVHWEDSFFDASSEIRDLNSGDILTEHRGNFCRFSHDTSMMLVYFMENNRTYARVIDVVSGNIIAEFSSDRIYSFSCTFNADDSLLALYFMHDDMQIIDTSTWEILYTLTGGIWFNRDGNYIAHNNHAGYSDVQLIEAHTGQVIDEFLGSVGFSRDGQYWIRAEAVSYDVRDTQIINLDTDEVIYQRVGYGIPTIDDEGIVSVWDFSTQSTHYYNANINEFIREISGEVQRYDEFVIARYSPLTYLRDWETDSVYAIGRRMKATPDGRFVLVSNGVYVDVYGSADINTENMPPARLPQGIAISNPEVITLYSEPNAENPRIITESNMLNETYYDVLGQSNDTEWLFVSFWVSGRNPELVQGWIQNENLEVFTSWDDAPILDFDNPFGSLRTSSANR